MIKQDAVASLGQDALVRPGRVREALRANDRLKLMLTLLQAAAAHAAAPERPTADLSHEIAAADVVDRDDARWLRDLPAAAVRDGDAMRLPGWKRLAARAGADLATMARPMADDVDADPALAARVAAWVGRLAAPRDDESLGADELADLTRGGGPGDASLHRLVMDLHQVLNRMAARLGGEDVGGAHAWQLAADGSDRPLVEAFMRGLRRTRHLKLDHPGLDTSATRDGARLLIQNDIGTNSAHVLVLQVSGLASTLTYSDLHRERFAFFQALLAEVGAQWSGLDTRTTPGLNDGDAYHVGTASFAAADDAALRAQLEAIGARIVFLIDWNRARKRLQAFVDKPGAVAVLREAARREVGHMAWLAAGGERLAWNAMAAQGAATFRLGDRLDEVLGEEAARDWLVEMLAMAQAAAARVQPAAFVADEVRLSLARRLLGRHGAAELMQEHAAWCQALAQAIRDGLAHGVERDADAAEHLATRAKGWERQADELVMRARARAERQPSWTPYARLVERSDDVADALEEAAFVLSLVADHRGDGWGQRMQQAMLALAEAVLGAVQDHVRAVAIAATPGEAGIARVDDAEAAGPPARPDAEEALDALWRVVQAERQCDELLRSARRLLARDVRDAALLQLGNEFAAAMELASDHLLAVGYALREQALHQAGAAS
jgi:uncharacterized protein Yka (UPF0111/DUF47 family)